MRERELDFQIAEILPERETLTLANSGLVPPINLAVVPQTNIAVAVNVLSPSSTIGIAQKNIANLGAG